MMRNIRTNREGLAVATEAAATLVPGLTDESVGDDLSNQQDLPRSNARLEKPAVPATEAEARITPSRNVLTIEDLVNLSKISTNLKDLLLLLFQEFRDLPLTHASFARVSAVPDVRNLLSIADAAANLTGEQQAALVDKWLEQLEAAKAAPAVTEAEEMPRHPRMAPTGAVPSMPAAAQELFGNIPSTLPAIAHTRSSFPEEWFTNKIVIQAAGRLAGRHDRKGKGVDLAPDELERVRAARRFLKQLQRRRNGKKSADKGPSNSKDTQSTTTPTLG